MASRKRSKTKDKYEIKKEQEKKQLRDARWIKNSIAIGCSQIMSIGCASAALALADLSPGPYPFVEMVFTMGIGACLMMMIWVHVGHAIAKKVTGIGLDDYSQNRKLSWD